MSRVHHELSVTGPDGFREGLPSVLGGALLDAFGTSEAADVRLEDIER